MKCKLLIFFILFLNCLGHSQNKNISEGAVFDGEPFLAINPYNPKHLVVAWMGWVNFANRIQIKTKTSFDGGSTWSSEIILPHLVSNYTSADPSIDFNADGEVFCAYVDFTGLNTNPFLGSIALCKSTDGGVSWLPPVEAVNMNVDLERRPIDRPWLVIDRSSSQSAGNIYITTMNGQGAILPYHPYVSISKDNGETFQWKVLDGDDWLSGNFIPQPMPTPAVSTSGTFHAIYPSLVLTQNLQAQYIIASSENGGDNFTYNSVISTGGTQNEPLAKKGQLMRVNPSDANHIVFIYLEKPNGDLDVFLTESFDKGISWTAAQRVNDDPVGNSRMQDLVWADFDSDGGLVVSWRDRRNGSNESYETDSEIWAAYRPDINSGFGNNFQITTETISFEPILAEAGNDFMNIQLEENIIHAVWGDPRGASLNIWYQKLRTDGTFVSLQNIANETNPAVLAYPNPTTDLLTIEFDGLISYSIFDYKGVVQILKTNLNNTDKVSIDFRSLTIGVYFIEIQTTQGTLFKKVIKN